MKGITKKHLQISKEKTNHLMENWAKYTNNHNTEKEPKKASKPTKRCSTSLAARKIQIKIMVTYPFISISLTKIKNFYDTKCW